jgi:hypothetical protein
MNLLEFEELGRIGGGAGKITGDCILDASYGLWEMDE